MALSPLSASEKEIEATWNGDTSSSGMVRVGGATAVMTGSLSLASTTSTSTSTTATSGTGPLSEAVENEKKEEEEEGGGGGGGGEEGEEGRRGGGEEGGERGCERAVTTVSSCRGYLML